MQLGKILYQGEWKPVMESTSNELRLSTGSFWISKSVYQQTEKFQAIYNSFCQNQLKEIIYKFIEGYKYKEFAIFLPYKTPNQIQYKKTKISIYNYLKSIGYSTTIKIKIGKYTQEWGINVINSTYKEFCLHFNLDLIKYDNYWHIRHVVAHELSHIFHRDHGEYFYKTLQTLDPYSATSKSFFEQGGIYKLFTKPKTNTSFFYLIMILCLFFLSLFWLFQIDFVREFVFSVLDIKNTFDQTKPVQNF